MKEQFKKFLNEEQDPKAIEKITSKLNDLLMKNEEIGYIAVQKKPAITVFPDSLVLTNKRIIICKPKNLGLSMDFIDYTWDDIVGAFVKENILGSEFSFNTTTDLQISIDYIPKIQARKIYTYAKEQLDLLKNPVIIETPFVEAPKPIEEATNFEAQEIIEEIETEEVTNFAEIMPTVTPSYTETYEPIQQNQTTTGERKLSELSKEELFDKLQNYKKLLDNGLILQGEYDTYKKEILSYM
ncbi:PH domain-containing protein [Flavobacterium sp. Fl-77]|uniref:PH domain-containing protein n=1 Tax=Flavobacterium flavipigmentatum TaxID=2893884 RepID=A0AAJ2S5G6_9FLAO|nr:MULTISPECIES: PH domain-containing protein [unclassified Flavobacterium]MDX6181262.1 PH domain-containing protein [Flavobacterium sp. Fl-33]MDX6184863.1 PH domain-containing protein [Flavobacterium sp. Fl-77]UFH39955.1 PH domain-containing protein [Flavobacterium sp. F-70]